VKFCGSTGKEKKKQKRVDEKNREKQTKTKKYYGRSEINPWRGEVDKRGGENRLGETGGEPPRTGGRKSKGKEVSIVDEVTVQKQLLKKDKGRGKWRIVDRPS